MRMKTCVSTVSTLLYSEHFAGGLALLSLWGKATCLALLSPSWDGPHLHDHAMTCEDVCLWHTGCIARVLDMGTYRNCSVIEPAGSVNASVTVGGFCDGWRAGCDWHLAGD